MKSVVALPLVVAGHRLVACAVCMGDPEAPLMRSAAVGMFFFLTLIVAVLIAMTRTYIKWRRRAEALES